MRRTLTQVAAVAALTGLAAGCSADNPSTVEHRYPDKGQASAGANNPEYGEPQGIFGSGGLSIFGGGGGGKEEGTGGGGGIGVNAYLWRASLDTVSFMPLASAAPSRSEDRRAGKGCVRTCQSRGGPSQ